MKAATYGWIIDEDIIEDGRANGIAGPAMGLEVHPGEGEPFKIYDGDHILYATGRIVGDYSGFEPVDDFAQANWGAPFIQYMDASGAWKFIGT